MNTYEKYKDSGTEWIGDIPEHWDKRRFKYCFDLVSEKSKDDLPKIGLENIESWTGKFIKTNSQFEGDGGVFKKNDILYGKLRPYLAKVYLADFEGKAVGDIFIFRCKEDLHPKFGNNLILSKNFIEITNSSTFGSKMPRVSWEFISNLIIPIPPTKEEQKTIANYLDKKTLEIDQLISEKKYLVELYQEEKTAIINQAITKGINPNVKLKDSGIEWLGFIPEHWEIGRVKNICKVRQGLQIPIDKRLNTKEEDSLEYITIKSINNPSDAKQYILNPSKNVICFKDDILMARTGATGVPITGVEGVFHNNFFLIDYNRKTVEKMFLYYYLKSSLIYEYLLLVAGTTTIPDLNHDSFYSTPFFLFDKKEQIEITQYIEKESTRIDAKIFKAKKYINLLTEYKTALISEVVTGKIKVID